MKNKRLFLWVFLLGNLALLFLGGSLRAQDALIVSGICSDNLGPMSGVSVVQKGMATPTITDLDGKYTIKVTGKAPVLQFSFISYATTEVKVDGRTNIDVILHTEDSDLDEVVIVGYQSVQKRFTSGSVSSVKPKDLENLPSANLTDLLAGKATGVTSISLGGAPGGMGAIQIRGNSVISAGLGTANQFSNPLYVIDGVPTTLEEIAGYGKTNTDYLTTLNVEDIESIDILKDASAAAIYGSRGANGVIIIKTKGGGSGKMTVSAKISTGVTFRPKLTKTPIGATERRMKLQVIQSTWDYKALQNDLSILLTDSLNYAFNNNVDYQGLFYQTGIVQDYSAAVKGGTEQLNYRLSIGYYGEDGILKNTGLDRYSMNLNLTQKPFKSVRNQTIINATYTDQDPGLGSGTNQRGNFPVSVIDMKSSLLYLTPDQESALVGKMKEIYKKDQTFSAQATNFLNIDIWKGLIFNSQVSAQYRDEKVNKFTPSTLTSSKLGAAEANSYKTFRTVLDHYLSFSRDITPIHNLNAIVGTSYEFNRNEIVELSALGGSSDKIITINGYQKDQKDGRSSISEYAMLSYFTRIGYRFKNRYQIDLNYRRDASSRFGKDSRWGEFPSVGAFWTFSEESFLSFANDWLDFGKIKYSIGRNGSQFSDNYLRYNMYTTAGRGLSNQGDNMYTTTYNGVTTAIPNFNRLADSKLSWEESVQSDFGVDLEFFKHRLYVNYNFYNKNTERLLFDVDFPDYTGFKTVKSNVAGVRNTGYELSVIAHVFPRNNKITLEINTGLHKSKNVITKLPNDNRDYLNAAYNYGYVVGRPGPVFYGMIYDGPLQSLDDLPINPYTGKPLDLSKGGTWGNVTPGYPIWRDTNGDYIIGAEGNPDEVFTKHNPNPDVDGHLNLNLGYKQWNLRVNTNFVFGRDVYNEVGQKTMGKFDAEGWETKTMINLNDYDYWTLTNRGAFYPGIVPTSVNTPSIYAFRTTTMWWEKGDFWKINTVQLSYNVDRDWVKKNLRLERLYLYATAYNVWQWQKSKKLIDASMVDSRGYAMGDGYPNPRKFSFGINVEF